MIGSMGAEGGCGSSSSDSGSSSSSSKGSGTISHLNSSAVKDVTITDCTTDEAGYATSKVKITNHSSKPSNYMVTVAFESKDGSEQIGTGTAIGDTLQPNQSTTQEANSLKQAPKGSFVCKVSQVERYAS